MKRNKVKMGKKGQEEIVGFAFIIIVVAVIILFLLSFSLQNSKKEEVESYEADSFVQATLQYDTYCGRLDSRIVSVQNLIFECSNDLVCFEEIEEENLPEIKSCVVLEAVLEGIMKESWPVGTSTLERPVKGYELLIIARNNELLTLTEGNATNSYKGALQEFPSQTNLSLKVYY